MANGRHTTSRGLSLTADVSRLSSIQQRSRSQPPWSMALTLIRCSRPPRVQLHGAMVLTHPMGRTPRGLQLKTVGYHQVRH